jgi:hypothetical protein
MSKWVKPFPLALAAVLAAWFFLSWDYLEDDAFIHLEFARNLLGGQGFSFDGRHVFADSSPLWVGLIAGVASLGVTPFVAAKILAAFGSGFYVWAVHRLTVNSGYVTAWGRTGVTCAVILSPFTMTWMYSGMESLAAAAIAVLAVSIALEDRLTSGQCLMRVAGCSAFGCLLRFEIALLAVGLMAEIALRPDGATESGRARLRRLLVAAVVAFGPLAAWMIYAKLNLGTYLPTTNAAKRIGTSFSVPALLETVERLIGVLAFGYAAPLLAALLCSGRSWLRVWSSGGRRIRIALGWLIGLLGFYAVNRTAVQTRYLLMLAPSIMLVLVVAWQVAGAEGRSTMAKVGVALIVVTSVYFDVVSVMHRNVAKQMYIKQTAHLTEFLRTHVDASWPVAVYGIGQIAYESPQTVVDTGALTMPSALQYLGDERALLAWSRAQGARCFIPGDPREKDMRLVFDVPVLDIGWKFFPGQHETAGRLQMRCMYGAN